MLASTRRAALGRAAPSRLLLRPFSTAPARAPAPLPPSVVAAHERASAAGERTYKDPETGLTVFTAFAHAQRGVCCGARCRHCCYGHENVGAPRRARRAAAAAAAPRARPPRESRVYTRSGDRGSARLVGEHEAILPKFSAVFEAVGDVDELGVKLGVAAFHTPAAAPGAPDVKARLLRTQALLLDAGAALTVLEGQKGTYASAARDAFDDDEIADLEREVDALDAALPPLRNFVVATGPLACLALHDARVVCRRAERHVWKRVAELDAGERSRVESVARFLNRLSDFLFVAARGAAAQDVVYDVSANVRRKRREKGRGDDE